MDIKKIELPEVVRARIELWQQSLQEIDAVLAAELNTARDEELLDRFYRYLSFGTGGMRGELGAGTNRMNRWMVRRATKALGRYLKEIESSKEDAERQGVVIAYDSRRMSRIFSEEAAGVLAEERIKVYLFEDVTPTPELSFAVRHLRAQAGIVITASHNPPQYNGYKVYGPDGGQITPHVADTLARFMEELDNPFIIAALDLKKAEAEGLLQWIGQDIEDVYIQKIMTILPGQGTTEDERDSARTIRSSVKIAYSPLHGAGGRPVVAALKAAGFSDVVTVAEQFAPDGNFPTVRVPNPEEPDAIEKVLDLARRTGADLAMATDPDTDRLGVLARTRDGSYMRLNGNELGALFVYYILSERKARGDLSPKDAIIKTIVTSELGRRIAEDYGVTCLDVLTGFKFIGEKIGEFEQTGAHRFIFGYEESYGYLAGDFVRDKDGVQAAVLAAAMADHYKRQGKTLAEILEELYRSYGAHAERLYSFELKGLEGAKRMQAMMEGLRKDLPRVLAALPVIVQEDYVNGEGRRLTEAGDIHERYALTLPRSDVLKLIFADRSWVAVRPSGTEPKVKLYTGAVAETVKEAEEKAERLERAMRELLEKKAGERL
ncbi:MAG: Phosphomannomutase [Candidatus Carbobacillus altaicus]|uniref:Phosphoglucomutase n=1 Tax=Candidatus Carbonibacillus altaicus TaxID=2163959 RepID=A0A2R6Y455_9BACL|nr:MAG: Phosphomannomutase [Candidatus Carbobacillus altaicus]